MEGKEKINQVNEELAQKMRRIREELNLNQAEFAKKLGVKQSYLSAMELGKKMVSANVTQKLFQIVGVSPNWFYNSIGNIFGNISGGKTVGGLVPTGTPRTTDYLKRSVKYYTLLISNLERQSPELYTLFDSLDSIFEFREIIDILERSELGQARSVIYQTEQTAKAMNDIDFSFPSFEEYKLNCIDALNAIRDKAHIINDLADALKRFECEIDNAMPALELPQYGRPWTNQTEFKDD